MFDVEQEYGLLQTLDDHSAAIQSVRFTDANNKLRMLSCGSDKSLLFRNAALVSPGEYSYFCDLPVIIVLIFTLSCTASYEDCSIFVCWGIMYY